jgi:hypothetical protein
MCPASPCGSIRIPFCYVGHFFGGRALGRFPTTPRMTASYEYGFAFPRRETPGGMLQNLPSPTEGAGNAGCALHPRSRVQNCAKKRTRAYRFSGGNPAFPAQLVLTAYAVLSPATNSSCHRHRRIEGFSRPVGPIKTSADLTPATGARTTRFCRPRTPSPRGFAGQCTPVEACAKAGSVPFVLALAARSRFVKNRPATSSAPALPRPPHPIPTSVTIAIRPSCGTGCGGCTADLGSSKTGLFLRGALDRAHA